MTLLNYLNYLFLANITLEVVSQNLECGISCQNVKMLCNFLKEEHFFNGLDLNQGWEFTLWFSVRIYKRANCSFALF